MSYYKGILFVICVCLSQILLTYLTMTLFPKLRKTKNPNYYRAAVLEAVPFSDSALSIKEVVKRNLQTYQLAASLANSNEVDIIVFPESVLFADADDYASNRTALIGSIAEDIPNPDERDYNPCDQEEIFRDYYVLRNLSCLAKNNGMYLVANVKDYKNCTNGSGTSDKNATTNCSDESECPDDGIYVYNTNVVFDRAGKLIARYHKKHLYFEDAMNPSKCPEDGYFATDFGNFTTIVCFDILFKEAEEAIEKNNVNNLAYPYYWYDNTPFTFFAPIFQHSFSVFNRINVLAANGHIPGTGTVGSGIFSAANEALIYTHQPDGHTKLLISNVPKQPKTFSVNQNDLNRKRFSMENGTFFEVGAEDNYTFADECETKIVGPPVDMLKDYRCDSNDLDDYHFEKLIDKEGTVKLCSESFCCTLSYKAYSMDEDYFLAVSATDFKLYKLYDFAAEACFVTRCRSEDGKRCTSFVLKSETVFENVDLEGTFINKYIYPFSIDSNIRLTKKDQWQFNGKSTMTYQNLNTNSSLLFLGLFGRDFGESN